MLTPDYIYTAQLVRVIDGDTLRVTVDLGFDVSVEHTLRLARIDTPKGKTPEGLAATAYTENWLAAQYPDGRIVIRTIRDRKERYGRYLAEVLGADVSLNDALLASGHAAIY